jgi:hypothetical protein
MKNITKTIQIKVPLTDAEKLEILSQITEADTVIKVKSFELDDLKEQEKVLKEAIEDQREIMSSLCTENKMGYKMKNVDCTVTYLKGIAKYIDVATGEVVDEHPMTESEQLILSENKVIRDAEDIIREDSDKE